MKVVIKTKTPNAVIEDTYEITHPVVWKIVSRVVRARTKYGKVTVYVKYTEKQTR